MALLPQVMWICRSRRFFVVRGQGHSSKLCAAVMKCLFSVHVYIFSGSFFFFSYTHRDKEICIMEAGLRY
jgi:hypothetical protein